MKMRLVQVYYQDSKQNLEIWLRFSSEGQTGNVLQPKCLTSLICEVKGPLKHVRVHAHRHKRLQLARFTQHKRTLSLQYGGSAGGIKLNSTQVKARDRRPITPLMIHRLNHHCERVSIDITKIFTRLLDPNGYNLVSK